MDRSVLENSSLFKGIPAKDLRDDLEKIPHPIHCFDKGATIFHLMESAERIGIVLAGHVQAQKTFPNGSQVNVSVRGPGELIGPAAVFSASRKYPCDVVAIDSATVMLFRRVDLLVLMQKDIRILENLMTEIASATYMLQQRLELFSYSGIAQKAAFWLLTRARQTRKNQIMIPESVSKWAMKMNVSRPSLHRELKRLESEGMIAYHPPVIELLDQEGLERILSVQ